MLHPDDRELFDRVAAVGYRLAESIGETCTIEPKRRPNGAGGLCYYKEKRISILIRVKNYAYDGGAWHDKPLSWDWLARIAAHEVAHLKERNHGQQFRKLEQELVDRLIEWGEIAPF